MKQTMQKDINLLSRAYQAWTAADAFRASRDRYKRYTYGDQWSDYVDDHNGGMVREADLLLRKGRRPLTNNLLRQLVKTIVGRYRNTAIERKTYDDSPDSMHSRNQCADIDARMLEEFIISGAAIQRVSAERRPSGNGIWIDNIDPRSFFVNRFTDPRGLDIELIGMWHDFTPAEINARFGFRSPNRLREIQSIYSGLPADALRLGTDDRIGVSTPGEASFFTPPSGKCRIYEIWTLDPSEHRNRLRIDIRFKWRCRWMAPDGTVLHSFDTPYAHGSHPFVVKLYPLIDGEIHSFIEDLLDQQRTINRLVVLIDTMMATAAKGTLLYPVKRLPAGTSIDDVARLWAAPDSVIPFDMSSGDMPQQVVTNTAESGAYQALSLQFKLINEISGMSDTIMGRNVSPSTGAALYESQLRNATVGLTDLLDTFSTFINDRELKARTTLRN